MTAIIKNSILRTRSSKEKTLDSEYTISKQQICPRYENCSAPLCPMDPSSMAYCIWYPGEDICSNSEFKNELWIQNQKKIEKMSKLKPVVGYFTYRMLERKFIIRMGIRGIDPDGQEDSQLVRWFKDHPELSEEQINSLRQRGKEYGFKRA